MKTNSGAPLWPRDPSRAQAEAYYQTMGFTHGDMCGPIIGIANSFSEIVPGHSNLRQVADFVKRGISRGGGAAVEFGTIACCDGIATGDDSGAYNLPSRETIADSVEIVARSHRLDGLVLLGSCDKIVPGLIMGAARANIPAVFLGGGPALSGAPYGGRPRTGAAIARDLRAMEGRGEVDPAEVRRMTCASAPTCGSCNAYATANIMCCVAEVLGLSLPGAAAVPAVYAHRLRLAQQTGALAVELARRELKPRDIITPAALGNTVRYLMATGATPNILMHICAIAHSAGLDPALVFRLAEEAGELPQLLPPTYDWDMELFHQAGGVQRVLLNMREALDLSAPTVSEESLEERLRHYQSDYEESGLIHTLEAPYSREKALQIMRGNLCPGTGIAQPKAVAPEARCFKGPAVCFDSEADCARAVEADQIQPGQVVVIRYEGPRGGPGCKELVTALKLLQAKGLATTTAALTDGRFSSINGGCYVCQISPEAAQGGPIALVRDGDMIEIDIPGGRVELLVDPEELDRRRGEWRFTPKVSTGYLGLYGRLASSADRGGIVEYGHMD